MTRPFGRGNESCDSEVAFGKGSQTGLPLHCGGSVLKRLRSQHRRAPAYGMRNPSYFVFFTPPAGVLEPLGLVQEVRAVVVQHLAEKARIADLFANLPEVDRKLVACVRRQKGPPTIEITDSPSLYSILRPL